MVVPDANRMSKRSFQSKMMESVIDKLAVVTTTDTVQDESSVKRGN